MKQEIFTERAPKPIGPYSQAIKVGDFLFISGQIAIDPATGLFEAGDISIQTTMVLENIKKILQEASFTFDDVIKTTIYLRQMEDFPTVNSIYEGYVKKPYPARSTVGVSNLPKGALVEIDVIAYKS